MRKPRAAVFSIMKGGPDSAVASVRLARYVAEQLQLPLYSGSDIAKETRLELGIIINGPMLYVMAGKTAPAFAKFALRTPHLVWVQNDYSIYAPASESRSESGFRHDFGQRKNHLHYWTSCEMNVDRTVGSSYVNWNMLTYEPLKLPEGKIDRWDTALYYGAFRHGRRDSFDRYFRPPAKVVVSSVSSKFQETYRGKTIEHVSAMPHDVLLRYMRYFGCGLYLEDRRSHKEFHSPANRFYEMLSAGLPMLFEPEAAPQLARAGYNVEPYTVRDAAHLSEILRRSHTSMRDVRATQAKAWRKNYRRQLDEQLQDAWRKTLRVIR